MPSLVEDKEDRVDYTLMPLEQEKRIIERFMFGAKKYKAWDWLNYTEEDRMPRYASIHRHLRQAQSGDTSEDHLAAICVQAIILMHIEGKDLSQQKETVETLGFFK